MDKVDLKKRPPWKKKFCIFFQSTHQVGVKNVVKCYKDFFGYFNALKTHSVIAYLGLYVKTVALPYQECKQIAKNRYGYFDKNCSL